MLSIHLWWDLLYIGNMNVTITQILEAQKTIQNNIVLTRCDYSRAASRIIGSEVFLKLENTQRTGSFKIRGATNKIASLTDAEKQRGVIACSAGNHAQGVALSSALTKTKSVIVMPETAPLSKIEATKNYGAEVILYGQNFDESKEFALKLAAEKNYVFVHPYEDEKVIAGQGTIGLEILEQVKNCESIVVPIGGGGLISGIAVAAKSINPKIKIFGVQAESVKTMSELFRTGKFELPGKSVMTLADGIAVKVPSRIMYEQFISKYVDEIVTVSEGQIAEAIVFLLERVKTVAEGSGAAAVAAALNKLLPLGAKTCLLVCGGNIDLNIISGIIQKGQIQRGRLTELSVIMPDVPGSLNKLTEVLARTRANILEVHHDRVNRSLTIKETIINIVLETIDHEHIDQIKKDLIAVGARFDD
jgi:threonine dehydratase